MHWLPAMIGVGVVFRRFLAFLNIVVGVLLAGPAAADCVEGNLLEQAQIIEHRGVSRPELLSDGWTVPDGTPPGVAEAVVFAGAKAEVTWKFKTPMRIATMDIQADYDDEYVILGSLDGRDYETLWVVQPIEKKRGLLSRAVHDRQEKVRFVKLRARGGDKSYTVTELRLFCKRHPTWPAPQLIGRGKVENPESTATYHAFSGKIVVALLGLFLIFVVAPRLRDRFRKALLLLVIGMSALGWTHFGQFQGKTMIHTWDMFHYYVGSKYYGELGYVELYRCVAKLERERGRAERYERILVRNLVDNTLYPFWWTDTEEGRCRAEFSKSEWKEFGQDVDAFRAQMIAPPFEQVLGDHGFNATPFHATWLSAITKHTTPTTTTLQALAQIDSLALLVAVFSLAWGFGLPVAAVAALLIQVAAPWSYNWVGGGLGRHVWFAFSCLGIAFLKKGSPGRGTAALTVATLLRLFPIVLLGGLGVYFISEWIREKRLSAHARRALAGCALTIGVGLAIVTVSYGAGTLGRFADVITAHAEAPAGNRMGFPHLLSLGPGKMSSDLTDDRLTDPSQPWRETVSLTVKERSPLLYLAILASLGVIGWAVWTIRSPWVSVLAAGPLLYSLQAMTSYDYIWLVLLVPVAFERRRALQWLCGFSIFTQVVGIFIPDMELRHWIYALSLFPTMTVFSWELVNWGKRAIEGLPGERDSSTKP